MIADVGSLMTQEEFDAQVRPYVGPFPSIPHHFDIENVSDAELMHYGLVPRPDKKNERLFALWLALVTTPSLTKPKKTGHKPLVVPIDYRLGFSQPIGGGQQETSRNWSGIATEAKGGRSFKTIYGQWQLPKMQMPAGGQSKPFACSMWIGLDGHDPTSSSMPQIGVTMSMIWTHNAWRPHYQAWSQWWQRDQRNPVNAIPGFPVAENDVIVCGLSISSAFVVLLNIANLTQNCAAPPFTMLAPFIPTQTLPLPVFRFYGVRGHTAEWIAERPKEMNPSGKNETYFPLPDFDTVKFDNCFVQGSSPLLFSGLTPSRVIRMQEMVRTPQPRSQILSRARKDAIDPYHKFVVGPGIEKAMCA